ncbi:MAG: hypothetical protein GX357_04915 [Firmicutes bacterium]|nr:hypothetical protein [Bacillota bacterium]
MESLLQQLKTAYQEAKEKDGKRQVLQDIILNRKTGEFRFVFKTRTNLTKEQ